MKKALCENETREKLENEVLEKFQKVLNEYKNDDGTYNTLECAYTLFFMLDNLIISFNSLKGDYNAMKAHHRGLRLIYDNLELKYNNLRDKYELLSENYKKLKKETIKRVYSKN